MPKTPRDVSEDSITRNGLRLTAIISSTVLGGLTIIGVFFGREGLTHVLIGAGILVFFALMMLVVAETS